MSKIDLSKYGISGVTEIVHNPSYEQLFEEETKPGMEQICRVSSLFLSIRQNGREYFVCVLRETIEKESINIENMY